MNALLREALDVGLCGFAPYAANIVFGYLPREITINGLVQQHHRVNPVPEPVPGIIFFCSYECGLDHELHWEMTVFDGETDQDVWCGNTLPCSACHKSLAFSDENQLVLEFEGYGTFVSFTNTGRLRVIFNRYIYELVVQDPTHIQCIQEFLHSMCF